MSAADPRDLDARLDTAESLAGHRFSDRNLLLRALTHPSYTEEPHAAQDYERIEFLGDAVLGLVVVHEIFERFPYMPEGQMTKLKIGVIAGRTLTDVAQRLGLGELLLLGPSETGTDGRGMTSALENAFEALIGALYLDAGLDAARDFILRVLGDRIDPQVTAVPEHPKSMLQEILQARGLTPVYEVTRTAGPPHDRVFQVRVVVDGKVMGTGSGHSKKEAEMNAAEQALGSLNVH